MYKILLGVDDGSSLLLILKDTDFQRLRALPLVDVIRIDCSEFGRPDITVLMTYATNRNAAREYVRQNGFHEVSSETSDRRFTRIIMGVNILGSVLTEGTLKQFEAAPMRKHITLKGGHPQFAIDITYTNSERAVVRFLREIGVPLEKITTDPMLAPLRDLYAAEAIELSRQIAATHGSPIPIDDSAVEISMGSHAKAGTNEQVMIAVRGEEIAWFARHPAEEYYYRRAVPGEFPTEVKATWVKVIKIKTKDGMDVRARMPMTRDATGNFVECRLPHKSD